MARKIAPVAGAVVAAAVASALLNRWLARKAEGRNPPKGRFITVDGVRLHYVERGSGTPLILLHGNESMIEDFQCSGLIDLAAKKYRVIAFDRPGFGHSERLAAQSGRRKRRPALLPPLSRKTAYRAQSFSDILGERWWPSLLPSNIRKRLRPWFSPPAIITPSLAPM
jgi:pimeloyl-ACP methyl ester carboxylesterase